MRWSIQQVMKAVLLRVAVAAVMAGGVALDSIAFDPAESVIATLVRDGPSAAQSAWRRQIEGGLLKNGSTLKLSSPNISICDLGINLPQAYAPCIEAKWVNFRSVDADTSALIRVYDASEIRAAKLRGAQPPEFAGSVTARRERCGFWAPTRQVMTCDIKITTRRQLEDTEILQIRTALSDEFVKVHGDSELNRRCASIIRNDLRGDTRPLISGYIHNTIALVLVGVFGWSLVGIPFAVRRMRRNMTDRCQRCGYELAGLPESICPECGCAITRQ